MPFLWHTFLVVRLLSYLPCLSCGIPFFPGGPALMGGAHAGALFAVALSSAPLTHVRLLCVRMPSVDTICVLTLALHRAFGRRVSSLLPLAFLPCSLFASVLLPLCLAALVLVLRLFCWCLATNALLHSHTATHYSIRIHTFTHPHLCVRAHTHTHTHTQEVEKTIEEMEEVMSKGCGLLATALRTLHTKTLQQEQQESQGISLPHDSV